MLCLALFFAVGCLANCAFYAVARAAGARHVAGKRALRAACWVTVPAP